MLPRLPCHEPPLPHCPDRFVQHTNSVPSTAAGLTWRAPCIHWAHIAVGRPAGGLRWWRLISPSSSRRRRHPTFIVQYRRPRHPPTGPLQPPFTWRRHPPRCFWPGRWLLCFRLTVFSLQLFFLSILTRPCVRQDSQNECRHCQHQAEMDGEWDRKQAWGQVSSRQPAGMGAHWVMSASAELARINLVCPRAPWPPRDLVTLHRMHAPRAW